MHYRLEHNMLFKSGSVQKCIGLHVNVWLARFNALKVFEEISRRESCVIYKEEGLEI